MPEEVRLIKVQNDSESRAVETCMSPLPLYHEYRGLSISGTRNYTWIIDGRNPRGLSLSSGCWMLNYHISRDKIATSKTPRASTAVGSKRYYKMLAGYVRLLCCLTATKLYHLRQTPLALYCRETRENTVATLMLRKIFLDGEIWNAGA